MVYLQACRFGGKIYSYVKNNFVYTLLINPFIDYFAIPNRNRFKEIFLEIYRFKKNGIDRHFTAVKCAC